MFNKSWLLPLAFLCLAGCDSQRVVTSVNQMYTAEWGTSTELDEANVWKTLQTFVVVSTADTCTLTALFVAECHGAKTLHVEPLGAQVNVHDIVGAPVSVRILIDDQVASPPEAIATSHFLPATHSFLASKRGAMPGTHTITVQWRSSRVGAIMGARTLTVWEAIERRS